MGKARSQILGKEVLLSFNEVFSIVRGDVAWIIAMMKKHVFGERSLGDY